MNDGTKIKNDSRIKKYVKESLSDYDKGEIALVILKSLLVIGAFTVVLALPGIASIYTLFKPKNNRDRHKIKRNIESLKKSGYVEVVRRGNGVETIKITQKGRRRVLKYDFDKMKINIPKKWDGVWRMVVFDVSEDKKKIRNALNYKLKDLGFVPIQKSVFVFPYECRDEIDFVGNFYGIRKDIRYMEIRDVDEDKKLKKKFGLW